MTSKLLLALFSVFFVSSFASKKDEDDKLHFVFELTRHGARAPMLLTDGYTVEEGMLTPQGMR